MKMLKVVLRVLVCFVLVVAVVVAVVVLFSVGAERRARWIGQAQEYATIRKMLRSNRLTA